MVPLNPGAPPVKTGPVMLLGVVLLGVTMVLREAMGLAAPAVLLLCAYDATPSASPRQALGIWWFLGLIRDLALGVHMGVGAGLFLLAGLIVGRSRSLRTQPGLEALALFPLALGVLGGETALQQGGHLLTSPGETLGAIASAGALTAAALVPWRLTVGRLLCPAPVRNPAARSTATA